MPNKIFFIHNENNALIGALRLNDDNVVEYVYPEIGSLLLQQRKEMVSRLCEQYGWNLVTPKQYEKLPRD